ncbi:ATP-dependent DNA helicase RecG [Christensenellaceae bacterium OttesenSCG-928-K19]|nr:ATP-dependent DNA helicase RecG [Christensenellaceae bacterium OttesenSCG-928-K19]
MRLSDDVKNISGVGEKTEKTLGKVGIYTMRDLLYYLPRTYADYSTIQKIKDMRLGESGLFEVTVFTPPKTRRVRKGMEITSFQVSDESAVVGVDIFNQVHIKKYIHQGDTLYIYGKLVVQMKKPLISGPVFFFKKPEDPFFPVYPLTAGLTQNMLRKFLKAALNGVQVQEPYSQAFLERFELPCVNTALSQVHFPRDMQSAMQARERIVFDELLVFCRMIELLNEEKLQDSEIVLAIEDTFIDQFVEKLAFSPTGAQRRIMGEIAADFAKSNYMNRLVQGDVGSGKTILAFFAMEAMRQNGYQSVMMAPTEILAEQHKKSAVKLFGEDAVSCITGSLTAKQRKAEEQRIAEGSAKVVIGTHALIYKEIKFHNLGLLITDEQHRFGVKQRAAISGSHDVHSLIMSATPIPRSLALVLYGKTDISIVDELPPGRLPIKTYLIRKNKYADMIGFVKREIENGRQAYIVCPLIEEGEMEEVRSAQEVYAEVQREYPGYELALLHGKLKGSEKQRIMQEFAEGKIKVLVSTTVIEVGVDVPNATVMAVQNAERFGLAQLHQLRGRVGRGNEQSYCFLVSSHQGAFERLKVMVDTNDGFEIAERDMQFRGTGDVFGTRQHGQGFNLVQDIRQLEKARKVLEIMRQDGVYRQEYEGVTKAASQKMQDRMLEIVLN